MKIALSIGGNFLSPSPSPPPKKKTIEYPTKRPSKISLKEKNGERREEQWDRKMSKSRKLSAKALSYI